MIASLITIAVVVIKNENLHDAFDACCEDSEAVCPKTAYTTVTETPQTTKSPQDPTTTQKQPLEHITTEGYTTTDSNTRPEIKSVNIFKKKEWAFGLEPDMIKSKMLKEGTRWKKNISVSFHHSKMNVIKICVSKS